jgi:hypothetical protein
MAKKTVTPAYTDPGNGFPLSIDEFCAQISLTDKRVEMIAAFNKAQKRAGNRKNYANFYAMQFAAFVSIPA